MGGPGYRDFNYTEAYAPIYDYITPDKPELWRRSIYRFIVRTTPHQFMSTLDCPNPANLTPARVEHDHGPAGADASQQRVHAAAGAAPRHAHRKRN